MKPPRFHYERPESVSETLELLAAEGDRAKVLAGGQSLVALMNLRLASPEIIVDIGRCDDLRFVRANGSSLQIGTLTTQATVAGDASVAQTCPLLAEAVEYIAHAAIRNRGTIGGSIAHADPSAELPVAATALEARIHVRSRRGARVLSCQELYAAPLTTTLARDELVVEIELPPQRRGDGTAFVEFARRHGDFALGGAAVRLGAAGDGTCDAAAIVLLGAGSVPARAQAAEALLTGRRLDDPRLFAEAARAGVAGVHPTGDIHGGSEYRLGLLETMVRRGLEQAALETT